MVTKAQSRTALQWLVAASLMVMLVAIARLAMVTSRADAAPYNLSAPGAVADQRRLAGVGSCSAAACHHANGPSGTKGSEYTTWIAHDKHARAFEVLYDERSKIIERNLKGLKSTADAHPEKNLLCLKCHVDPQVEKHLSNPRFQLADGVHCENCHGPAERWLAMHHLPEWRSLTDQEKQALGMRPTKNLRVRAETCVACHVGSADADVNHDLVAAGHPRLAFELTNYLAAYPKHWNVQEDKQRHPDLEARLWALGQVLSAKQSLELLAARAEAAERSEPATWPEFAEYDCFACHQAIGPEVRRTQPGTLRRRGLPDWNTWYLPMTLALAKEQSMDLPLQNLQASMAKLSSDPTQVKMQARAAANVLDEWLNKIEAQKVNGQTLFKSFAAEDPQQAAATWDQAAQRYLALVATGESPVASPQVRRILQELRQALQFKEDYQSPFQGYDPRPVSERFSQLREQVAP
jgi:hypothetical protein